MFNPLIPYNWEPPSSDWEEGHFEFSEVESGKKLYWPLTGVTLVVPKQKYHPTLEEIRAANQDSFASYDLYGFSTNHYHEFLLLDKGDRVKEAAFKMGNAEITFGDASPLAAFAFDAYHREKYFGSWSDITSLRILGPERDQVELFFISAIKAYEETFQKMPVPYQIDESFLFEVGEEGEDEYPAKIKPPVADALLPLRFFYLGLQQSDDIAASINFYKVIEFFSFMSNEKSIAKLRHDNTVSDTDFSKQVLNFMSKDEKGPIFSLLKKIASASLLAEAHSDGLTPEPKIQQFSEALYIFRNSIVHGKYSYGYDLKSDSILTLDSSASKWRLVLKALARICIDDFAPKVL